MGQMDFFDIARRYGDLDAKNDPPLIETANEVSASVMHRRIAQ